MEALLNDAVSTVNTYLWNYLIIFILIGAGLFFTMTTGAVQIRMFKEMVALSLLALVLKQKRTMYPHSKHSALVPHLA